MRAIRQRTSFSSSSPEDGEDVSLYTPSLVGSPDLEGPDVYCVNPPSPVPLPPPVSSHTPVWTRVLQAVATLKQYCSFYRTPRAAYLDDEWYIQLAKLLRSRRTLARVLSFLGSVLFIFLLYTTFFIRNKISDDVYITETHDFSLAGLVTAAFTGSRHRTPARKVPCGPGVNISSVLTSEGYSLTLSSLSARMSAERAASNYVHRCFCAPQFGAGVAVMVVHNPNNGLLGWVPDLVALNPRIISMPLLSYSADVEVYESSTLYPNAAPVLVSRTDRCHLEYETPSCVTERVVLRQQDALCAQMCVDLMNGKTPYESP